MQYVCIYLNPTAALAVEQQRSKQKLLQRLIAEHGMPFTSAHPSVSVRGAPTRASTGVIATTSPPKLSSLGRRRFTMAATASQAAEITVSCN